MTSAKTLVVLSGGIDSVVLAHACKAEGREVSAIAIDYGQRHRKELEYAGRAAGKLNIDLTVADLGGYSRLMRGYSLTDADVTVPDEHYTRTGSVNVVPNRNPVFMTVAYAHAVLAGAQEMCLGFLAEDAATAPDTSPAFLTAFNAMEARALEGLADPPPRVTAPLLTLRKADVLLLGTELGVDWRETWTCFKGERFHCGSCASCHDRRNAFAEADLTDPTRYQR
ncbi:7-cyano-7-deazaguanine synthase [Streptomyces rimosus]|uniref:7-cyano-7-deazaguanine synthase n=1 Tax=Streptomyces rimosus TaxID=1927 RepID=UPI0004C0F643|nr:7-cyano-7-deazaguanine synthase [Streptomyces rimosus]